MQQVFSSVGGSWNDFKYSRARLINTHTGGALHPHKPQVSDGPEATARQELDCTSRQFTNFEGRFYNTVCPRENAHNPRPPSAFSRTLTGQERKYTLQSCSNLTPRIGTRKSSSIYSSEQNCISCTELVPLAHTHGQSVG